MRTLWTVCHESVKSRTRREANSLREDLSVVGYGVDILRFDRSLESAQPHATAIARNTTPFPRGPRSSQPPPNSAEYTIAHPNTQDSRFRPRSRVGVMSGARRAIAAQPVT